MKIAGIIPARYASSRFPAKALADIAGTSMIQRVYNQVKEASLIDQIIVATDHQKIYDHVKDFGGEVMMTKESHQSGTDRCHEVAQQLTGADFIINIQGDEPFINPKQIDILAKCLNEDSSIATLCKKITDTETLFDENTVKVIKGDKDKAIYFSRNPIPFIRGVEKDNWLTKQSFFKHVGIYAYKVSILNTIASMPQSRLEKAESLEQLRWLEAGITIQVMETPYESIGIDTPEDVEKAIKLHPSTI